MDKNKKRKLKKVCRKYKTIRRKIMKCDALYNELIAFNNFMPETGGIRNLMRAEGIKLTPYEIFRHDKPEIDLRRWRKHERKRRKDQAKFLTGRDMVLTLNHVDAAGNEATRTFKL